MDEISQRFLEVIDRLVSDRIEKSSRQIALNIGIKPSQLSDAKSGKRGIPDKYVKALADTYKVNLNYLYKGAGNVYKSENNANADQRLENKFRDTPRRTIPNATFLGDMYETEFEDGAKFRQVGNTMWAMNVPLVTEKAKAGWLSGFADANPGEELELYNIEVLVDFVAKGSYLAFEITGDSMNDGTINSIPNKTIVVGRELGMHQWKPRLYNNEYPNWVFVHRRDGIICKQIADQDIENGWLVHHSLNPDKNLYPDEKIELKDVFKIYNVVKRILP